MSIISQLKKEIATARVGRTTDAQASTTCPLLWWQHPLNEDGYG